MEPSLPSPSGLTSEAYQPATNNNRRQENIIMEFIEQTEETSPQATTEYAPRFTRDRLRTAVRTAYKEVACSPASKFHFTSGRPLAEQLGYGKDLLDGIPEGAIASFAGTGNPFRVGPVVYGETILDIAFHGHEDRASNPVGTANASHRDPLW